MSYLASLKFVHRDLATRNILLNRDGTIKITDFGVTRGFGNLKDGSCLPRQWLAPEIMKYEHFGQFSEKTDVWAFGMTCIEIYNRGERPYPGTSDDEVVEIVVKNKAYHKIPDICPERIFSDLIR